MSFTAGKRLGAYEILAPLGEGGMGQVYKGRDTRLDRTVAIKVLSPQVAGDKEFRARFEREAKAISQLQHPHICTLHDIGCDHETGTDYLVLEYLEGETLAERLRKGPVPLAEALKIAIQISDGLDKAHRLDIVHRDLKPGNVMLTKTGAKLLDFGLAKSATAPGSGSTDLSAAMTRTTPLTGQGMILGTFQYMAPEQIEGADADVRSDIWAFGCVIHEMLTGQRTFEGKTHAGLMSAILKDEVAPVSGKLPLASSALDHVVETCLAKDPDERWQSAADVTRELTWIAVTKADETASAAPTGTGNRERLLWAAGLATAVVLFLASRGGPEPQSPTTAVSRATIVLDEAFPATGRQGSVLPGPVLSPDGRFLAYATTGALALRDMSTGDTRLVPESGGADSLFFSPDSRSIGFSNGTGLRKMTLSGGAPVSLTSDTPDARGGTWGDDGYIYYTPFYSSGLWRVAADGGTPEELTTPDATSGEKTHRFPHILPGSRALLFVTATAQHSTFDDADIEVLELGTGERRVVVEGGTYPRYVETGHLLYSRGSTVLAVPFDVDRLEVTGDPVVVAEDVLNRPAFGNADFAVSSTGTFVSIPPAGKLTSTVLAVTRAGQTESLAVVDGEIAEMRLSPDGTRLVVRHSGATSQLSVRDLGSGQVDQLTFEWDNESPVWTGDGSRIVFSSNAGGGRPNLFWQSADGSDRAERLTASDNQQRPGQLSSPGDVVPFTEQGDIWVVSVNDGSTERVVETPFVEGAPAMSPDGLALAFMSDQNPNGEVEVLVQTYPSNGRRVTVSRGGGALPVWHPNGRELFYRSGESVMAVQIDTSRGIQAGAPIKLFDTVDGLHDVFADGRLLMRRLSVPPVVTRLDLVFNWFEELRQKMADASR